MTKRWSIPDHVVLQELEGESILLHTKTEKYYSLNDSASRMILLLDQVGEVNEALQILITEFEVSESQLRDDFKKLRDALKKKGLLAEKQVC